MIQSIGLSVAGWVVAVFAIVLSVRYFLISKPADEGPVIRSQLLFGRIHPQMLLKCALAALWAYGCWILSRDLVSHGDRVLAGLTLAAGTPGALFIAISLTALGIMLVSRPLK